MSGNDNNGAGTAQAASDDPMAGWRMEIDAVDKEIVALLNRRAKASMEVGKLKSGSGEIVFKPFREKEVFEKLFKANSGPLPEEHLRSIYREIMSSSRSLQRPQTVGYLGPEGTFSYFAGVEFLGRSVDYRPMPDIPQVFKSVAEGVVELGVIPLENSLQGTVGQSLDLFQQYEVYIQAEMFCRISHCLMGQAGHVAEVRTVYSHSQPLAQCQNWIRTNMPQARITPAESTAQAARMVAGEPWAAAIGHKELAKILNLGVIATGIEDQPNNWTRFLVIGASPAATQARDKTSMLFTVPNNPGSLVHVLQLLSDENINMKKLESRPLQGESWRYIFFVDVEADLSEAKYDGVLKELEKRCHSLRILGSYPAGPRLDMARRNGDG